MLQKSQTVGVFCRTDVVSETTVEGDHASLGFLIHRRKDQAENSSRHLAQEVTSNSTRGLSKSASFGSEEVAWWTCLFCTLTLQAQGQGVWTERKSQSWFNGMYLSFRGTYVNISAKVS